MFIFEDNGHTKVDKGTLYNHVDFGTIRPAQNFPRVNLNYHTKFHQAIILKCTTKIYSYILFTDGKLLTDQSYVENILSLFNILWMLRY